METVSSVYGGKDGTQLKECSITALNRAGNNVCLEAEGHLQESIETNLFGVWRGAVISSLNGYINFCCCFII